MSGVMKRIRFNHEQDGTGNGAKRRQVKRACSKCRRSKRACRHVPDTAQTSPTPPNPLVDRSQHSQTESPILYLRDGTIYPLGGRAPELVDTGVGQAHSQSQASGMLGIPFAGSSSAHSLLLSDLGALTMNAAIGPGESTHEDLPCARRLRPSLQDIKAPPSERRPGLGPDYLPMVVRAVLPYLEAECLQPLPPQTHLDALVDVYRREVHPLLPIVDFSAPALSGAAGPVSVLLKKGMCLAACKNTSAQPHLYLSDEKGESGGPPAPGYAAQTTRDFADRLFHSLKIALDIGLVDDRLELVQLLALMTFHSYGRDGDDEVARLCGQAVHYAYSAGLHQPSSVAAAVPEPRRLELLCSIFALEKIIAMVTGRPTVAHERDMYFPPDEDEVWLSLPPGLRALFRLSRMLDRVLDLYRAGSPPGQQGEEYAWDASWPDDFEEFAEKRGVDTLTFPLQATLEMLYHTVSVMSYRPARVSDAGRDDADRGLPTPPPPPDPELRHARSRHGHSAREILSLPIPELAMLPFVPHAVSLALAAGLREARRAVLETSRRKAREQAEAGLAALEKLAERYWHAEAFGHTTRRLMDATYRNMAE